LSKVLVIDTGTTNIKAGVVDEKGRILGFHRKKLTLRKDRKGKAEHSPSQLWESFLEVSRRAVEGYNSSIRLVVITGYQFGFLPIDRRGNPLMGMITLQDTRSRVIMREIRETWDWEKIYLRTGCPPIFLYTLPRIFWLKKFYPEIYKETRWFLGSKDYLLYRILGKPLSEPSLASATQLFNIHTLEWDEEILELVSLEKERLPEIVSSEEILGEIPSGVRKEMGLKEKVYLLPGVYDGGALCLGMGGGKERVGICNLGTSAMLRVPYSKPVLDATGKMKFQTYYLCSNIWVAGGAINNGGLVLEWWKEILRRDIADLLKEAENIPPGSEGVFFLPFLTGERDPAMGEIVSGVIFGVRNYHTTGHLVRSSLEGIAYLLLWIKKSLEENGVIMEEVRVGGGGAKSLLWIEILRDILNLPVRNSEIEEPALVGEAILGYIALRVYSDIKEAFSHMIRKEELITPDKRRSEVYKRKSSFFFYLLERMEEIYREAERGTVT